MLLATMRSLGDSCRSHVGMAPGVNLATAVIDKIVAKTGRRPLVVEELTKAVLESGLCWERLRDPVVRRRRSSIPDTPRTRDGPLDGSRG